MKIICIKIDRVLSIVLPATSIILIFFYLVFGQRNNTETREFGRWEMFQGNIAKNCMIQFSNAEGMVIENHTLLGLKSQFEMKKSDFLIKSPHAVEKFIQKICDKALAENKIQNVLFVQAQCERSGTWVKLFEQRAVCE